MSEAANTRAGFEFSYLGDGTPQITILDWQQTQKALPFLSPFLQKVLKDPQLAEYIQDYLSGEATSVREWEIQDNEIECPDYVGVSS